MSTEYKVVRMADLFEWPTNWTGYEAEFAARFEEALNRMAADGWEFVETYAFHQHLGPGYATFRRIPGSNDRPAE